MIYIEFHRDLLIKAIAAEGIHGVLADTTYSARATMNNLLEIYEMQHLIKIESCTRFRSKIEFRFDAETGITNKIFLQTLKDLSARINNNISK